MADNITTFDLTVFGGKADAEGVDASRFGEILKGLTLDVRSVCRNLAGDNSKVSKAEQAEACRLYVTGTPQLGKSVATPMRMPLIGSAEAGLLATMALEKYAVGIQNLHSPHQRDTTVLPEGFDEETLRRVRGYCQMLEREYDGMRIDVPRNGGPAVQAVFNAELATNITIKLYRIHEEQPEPEPADNVIAFHTIQGVLYELSDQNYDNPEADVRVEVDPHDGTYWVCTMSKEKIPSNIRDLWRTTVIVEGTATLRPRKPMMKVDSLIPVELATDWVKALDQLVARSPDLLGGESVESAMNRIRERD